MPVKLSDLVPSPGYLVGWEQSLGEVEMENQESASGKAWLSEIERFSKILQEYLEQAKARSLNQAEIIELEQLTLKTLRLWKWRVPAVPRKRSNTPCKARWVKRKSAKIPRESNME